MTTIETMGADEFVAVYRGVCDRLVNTVRGRPALRLGTLGPEGTSSHDAAEHLQQGMPVTTGGPPFAIVLYDTFAALLAALECGEVDLALVPSAYRDVTAFHWHAQLDLVFHFARATPAYGLAASPTSGRRGTDGVADLGPVSVASVPEVKQLWGDLCPAWLRSREPAWVDARSTRHAAELVAAGGADLALTNDSSRKEVGLDWLNFRPGADIVWLVFQPAP